MMGSQGGVQQSHLQLLTRQNSWYNLTLNEVGHHLAALGKPLGCMNLGEILKIVWSTEGNQNTSITIGNDTSSVAAPPLQARALSEKTVNELWKDIQLGKKRKIGEGLKRQERELTLGEMTLEAFLIETAVFAECLDTHYAVSPLSFSPQKESLLSPLIEVQSHMALPETGRKRDVADDLDKALDRRLRRKIKNRESAARSRARKQAYHNELVNRVSHLRVVNRRLKKEEELEKKLPFAPLPPEPKYQLRRTNSATF